jgi:hypothetical protein
LRIAAASRAHFGIYEVLVSNDGGSILSQPARVSSGQLPPIPQPDGLLVPQGTAATVTAARLLENDADPDGDDLSVTQVSPNTSHGATVTLASGSVTYTPPKQFFGQDTFSYAVNDSQGLTATGRVDVLVYDGALPALNQLQLDVVSGAYRLRYVGTPRRGLELQRSTNLPHWSILQQVTIPPHGVVEHFETQPPIGGAYYRAIQK